MKYKSIRKPTKCPECGSHKIARIMYGLPAFTPGLEKELADQKTVLGGCCISNDDPSWKCVDCNTVIYKMQIDLDDSVN
jgi:hypothetical protein